MRSVTAEQMAQIDRRAREEHGIPQKVLMENAGKAVADIIGHDNAPLSGHNIAVFCGKGNNGGDGFVAARYLSETFPRKLVVYLASGDSINPGSALENYNMIKSRELDIRPVESFLEYEDAHDYTVIVDAVFGTGFKGDMSSEYFLMGEKINSMNSAVYAVDIPSGLNSTTGYASRGCIRALKTITFGLAKKGFFSGQGPDVCGDIVVKDIGFPIELLEEYK